MTLQMLLSWWNLIYLLPLTMALLYLVIYMVTGMAFADADADVHADADADADADIDADADADADTDSDADADADHDASVDHDADHDIGHDAGHGHGPSPAGALLGLVGLGKAPVSLILIMLLMLWGLVGLFANRLVVGLMPAAWLSILVSLPAAAVLSVLGTGGLARVVARIMPSTETYVRRKASLVGLAGETMYDITDGFGLVQVHDENGDLHQLPCRTRPGQPPIRKGQRVVLYDFDADKEEFYITLFDPAKPKPARAEEPEEPRLGQPHLHEQP